MDLPALQQGQKLATQYAPLQNSRLAGLMYIKADGGDDVNPPEAGVLLQSEVFTDKCLRHELMESLYVEFAITMPLLTVAVFCICVPTSMDWVVQSLYLRAYIAAIIPAIVIKLIAVYHHHKNPLETNTQRPARSRFEDVELNIILSLLCITMVLFSVFFLTDFSYPVQETLFTTDFADDFAFYAHKKFIFIITLLVMIMVIGFAPFYAVVAYGWEQGGESKTLASLSYNYTQRFMWNGAQMLMLILRLILIINVSFPELWYGYYDEKDVPLNVGDKIKT
eukprot:3792465-Rhodomonas_salina.1